PLPSVKSWSSAYAASSLPLVPQPCWLRSMGRTRWALVIAPVLIVERSKPTTTRFRPWRRMDSSALPPSLVFLFPWRRKLSLTSSTPQFCSWQVDEQQSPLTVLPSSQVSLPSTFPSPHTMGWIRAMRHLPSRSSYWSSLLLVV